jgi:hypothetical protein
VFSKSVTLGLTAADVLFAFFDPSTPLSALPQIIYYRGAPESLTCNSFLCTTPPSLHRKFNPAAREHQRPHKQQPPQTPATMSFDNINDMQQKVCNLTSPQVDKMAENFFELIDSHLANPGLVLSCRRRAAQPPVIHWLFLGYVYMLIPILPTWALLTHE